MPRFKLGKNQTFTAVGQTSGKTLLNADVRDVTVNVETANEANLTTRGSGDDQEFCFVHRNTSFDVVTLFHELAHGETVLVTIAPKTGFTGRLMTGMYYVNADSEPQNVDGAIEHTLTFRRTVSA